MNTIICTVGASMIGNLQSTGLKNDFDNENIDKIIDYYLNLDEDPEMSRKYGAEINSTVSILKKGYLHERKNIYFLVSDTKDGRKIGKILEGYFKSVKDFKFENVKVVVVEKLDDSRPQDFKIYGLKNLIKEMAKIIKLHIGNVIINATGGYKAQIAFALTLGQGLKVPVYYRFETFPEVIELEPLPIDLDHSWYFLAKNLFEEFDGRENLVPLKDVEDLYKSLPEETKIFFDIEKIDDTDYIAISTMGQIYLEVVKNKLYFLEKHVELKERDKEFKFISSGKRGNLNHVIDKYNLEELFSEFKYITNARVVKFSENEKSEGFKIKTKGNEIVVILNTKNGLVHLEIETTARNELELEIIKSKLEEYLSDKF
ncbi:putative CRISPR-associated protein [Fervidobacterium sp. 2310opik-2]|uniref:putative CRISPR-associated protein n=1 Tax=Fervidobacterium sp. 2310opik-2 TaxID=1755815 RepID=UPI0013DFF2E7|nr:putative CRISPR-associated protein [Fervidobacterium sp. 2310opik-2]KAF2961318.1 hypothetical protein AS161_01875 [Fervidobacterium sp. 2310opik-2]